MGLHEGGTRRVVHGQEPGILRVAFGERLVGERENGITPGRGVARQLAPVLSVRAQSGEVNQERVPRVMLVWSQGGELQPLSTCERCENLQQRDPKRALLGSNARGEGRTRGSVGATWR